MIMFAHQARQRLGDIWGVCAISQLFFKHNIFEKGIIIIIIIRWALVMIYKYIYIYTQGIFKFMYDSYDSDPERLLGLEIPWNSKSQVIHIWSRGLQKVVWACMELRGYVCYVYAYLYNIYITRVPGHLDLMPLLLRLRHVGLHKVFLWFSCAM